MLHNDRWFHDPDVIPFGYPSPDKFLRIPFIFTPGYDIVEIEAGAVADLQPAGEQFFSKPEIVPIGGPGFNALWYCGIIIQM